MCAQHTVTVTPEFSSRTSNLSYSTRRPRSARLRSLSSMLGALRPLLGFKLLHRQDPCLINLTSFIPVICTQQKFNNFSKVTCTL